jgi:hypothetical protein
LLRIAVQVAGASGIDPPPSVVARFEVFKVSEYRVSMVLLKVLVASISIPGLRSGVEPIKHLRFSLKIKSEALKMFVPVGIFDHHNGFWICGFRRLDDQVFSSLG